MYHWGKSQNSKNIFCIFVSQANNTLYHFRVVARDIGGSDPEKMAAPNVATYVQNIFKDTSVKVVKLELFMTFLLH